MIPEAIMLMYLDSSGLAGYAAISRLRVWVATRDHDKRVREAARWYKATFGQLSLRF
jgi:hypothetical protein